MGERSGHLRSKRPKRKLRRCTIIADFCRAPVHSCYGLMRASELLHCAVYPWQGIWRAFIGVHIEMCLCRKRQAGKAPELL